MLDGLLIIFNKEFAPKDTFVNSILSGMEAHGHSYKTSMGPKTPVKILVNQNAQDPTTFMASAMVHFRMMGIPFHLDRLEHATFEGNQGICGVILSHWS